MSRHLTAKRRSLGSRRSLRTALLIPLAGLLTACEESRYSMPNPGTSEGQEVLQLWRASFYAAWALGLLVLALIVYSVIRHRRRSNDELPTQTEGNTLLEITYTFIPFVLVGLLFFYGLKVQFTTTEITPASASAAEQPLVVDVTGYQWNWRFDYPAEQVTVVGGPQGEGDSGETLPTMVIPVDQEVRFNVIAADVAHSFFVPGFLTKKDLIPGIRNTLEVTPTREALFMGHCAEFCGLNHSQMNFRVDVVSRAEFDTWVAEQKRLAATQRQVPVS